jgi:threonine/homoserine/homoserine lactone efflux protein
LSLVSWWLFASATALVAATPGPNMLHILVRSVQLGFARSTLAMAGCLSAVIACVTVSSLGVGALLEASQTLFEVLRTAGAAYLIWLGVRAWKTDVQPADDLLPAGALDRRESGFAVYRTALLIGLSNPKLILFAAAFFPQFIRADRPWGRQFAILLGTFIVIEIVFYLIYATGGRYLARALSSPARQRLFARGTGTLFFLFGVGILVYRG